jgi:hypothetical protein
MTKKSLMLGLLLAGVLSVAATAPVAMRVELEPRRQVGDMTEVAVVVQVSPEDRIRIGANAIVRIELDGGTVSSGSPMRAVRLEDDGSTRIVVRWPPGEHHLRVEIEDPSKEDTGLWVGTVRIPDLGPDARVQETDEPQSDPDPEPAPENHEPVTPPPTDAEDAIGESVAAAAAPIPVEPPVPEPSSGPSPEAEEPEPVEATVEESPEPPAEEVTAIVGSAAVGAAAVPESPEPVAEENPVEIEKPEPGPVGVAESAPEEPPIEEPAPQQTEEPAEVTEEPPLVEPLRADPPPEIAEPEAVAPSREVEATPATAPVSSDLAARDEEWGSADPDIRELSMIVTRGREPAKDVDVRTFQLRVGGSPVAVERLGDAENAPLLLGLAIDVAADEVDDWPGMRGSLSPIVERAGGGRGRLFVATVDGIGAWDADIDAPGGVTLSQKSENVAGLVIASIDRFRGLHGRTFLVVLTDGRNEPAKDEWQQATESAGAAGVPILVIALWDDQFNNRVRKNLKKLTEVSGGSLFLVQGRAQLESAADRFGRYLDGGYSLRFRSPGGDRQTAIAISVSASDKQLDVSAPKSIR